ncbi:hypothetical protein Tco_1104802 [Tanacetum coccineum]
MRQKRHPTPKPSLSHHPTPYKPTNTLWQSYGFSLDMNSRVRISLLGDQDGVRVKIGALFTLTAKNTTSTQSLKTSAYKRKEDSHLEIQRISLIGFPAQSVGSSNTDVLDSPCLLFSLPDSLKETTRHPVHLESSISTGRLTRYLNYLQIKLLVNKSANWFSVRIRNNSTIPFFNLILYEADINIEVLVMNRVGSIEPFENPLDTRKLESSSYHALGACLRPYNAFLRR